MLVSMDSPAAGLVLVFCGFGTQHPKAAINFSGQGKSREVMSSSSLPLIHLIPSCCRQSLTGPSGKRARGMVKTYQWSEWSPTSKRMKGRGEELFECFWIFLISSPKKTSAPRADHFATRPFWYPPTMRKIFQKNGGRRPLAVAFRRDSMSYSLVLFMFIVMFSWLDVTLFVRDGILSNVRVEIPTFQVTSPASGAQFPVQLELWAIKVRARCIPWKLQWVTAIFQQVSKLF